MEVRDTYHPRTVPTVLHRRVASRIVGLWTRAETPSFPVPIVFPTVETNRLARLHSVTRRSTCLVVLTVALQLLVLHVWRSAMKALGLIPATL